MKVISNNPLFKENDFSDFNFIDGNYLDVLKSARDYIHKGFSLLNHPLYGSVKPNETIYRTILLKEEKALDENSLMLIEDAITFFNSFESNSKPKNWPERILNDFQYIDKSLIMESFSHISNCN
ncbi:MAG: GrdX family protein [Tissierellia bacterium]|nr:GrdX family protein [Tissierellia bacterium]